MGKVILEKIMWSCPDIKKIFVMVRPKRKVEPMERVKREILKSDCFRRLKQKYGPDGFVEWAQSKIVPIQGDLVIDQLGISPDDRAMITREA